MSSAYERLVQFLDTKMQVAHIYQPVMLEVLLTHGGRAPIRTIAAAILAHDESQIDYYTEIVKQMPGRVLGRHGIVKRQGDDYTCSRRTRPPVRRSGGCATPAPAGCSPASCATTRRSVRAGMY